MAVPFFFQVAGDRQRHVVGMGGRDARNDAISQCTDVGLCVTRRSSGRVSQRAGACRVMAAFLCQHDRSAVAGAGGVCALRLVQP